MNQTERRARIHNIRTANRRIVEAKLAQSSALLSDKEALGHRIAALRTGSIADRGPSSGAAMRANGEMATRLDAALMAVAATLNAVRRGNDQQRHHYNSALRDEAAAGKLAHAAIRLDRHRHEHRQDAQRIFKRAKPDMEVDQ